MRLGEREHRAHVDEPVPSAEDELENEKGLVSLSRPRVLSGSVGRGLANLKPGASSSGRAQSQHGQEQGHKRPEQGGQDAPPLGELLEGQQPEQGENAGDRHTKQTFIESLGEPIDARHEQHDEPDQAVPLLGKELGVQPDARLWKRQRWAPRAWRCSSGSKMLANASGSARQRRVKKPAFRVREATSTGSARRPRREKVSDRTNKKGNRRPSCAERLTSA